MKGLFEFLNSCGKDVFAQEFGDLKDEFVLERFGQTIGPDEEEIAIDKQDCNEDDDVDFVGDLGMHKE